MNDATEEKLRDKSAEAQDRRTECRGQVLLVEDEPQLLRSYSRLLTTTGFQVESALDGRIALELLKTRRFDVIVSDILMPGLDGLQLLRAVRDHDLDVPVVLITGTPTLDTAIRALEYGALRYLVKPVDLRLMEEVLEHAVRLHRLARMKREALALLGDRHHLIGDRAGLEASFDRALGLLWMAYQPIIRWSDRTIFGYEALLRTSEPALPNPGVLIDAAERLKRLPELGAAIRQRVLEAIGHLRSDELMLMNLHPHELQDPAFLDETSALWRAAGRLVLEITERLSLEHIPEVRTRISKLKQGGFRIALDDLGGGYAGLNSFALLEPQIVKLDMVLVRDLEREPTKQRLIRSMCALCRDMGVEVIGEGVETEAERDTLASLGCDLMQGYLFARPAGPNPGAVEVAGISRGRTP